MRVEVVSSRGQIAKRTGWALRLLITQSFGNIVRTRLVSPLVFCGPSLPKPSHGGAPWWPRKRRKATWHVCGTASIRAGVLITSFLFLRMCFPLHSDRKKHPKSSGSVYRHDATMVSDIKGCGALCTGSCPPAPPISMLPTSLDDRPEQKRLFFSWRVSDPLGASIIPTLKLRERGAHALGHLIDSPSSWHHLTCIPTIIEGRAIFLSGWSGKHIRRNNKNSL